MSPTEADILDVLARDDLDAKDRRKALVRLQRVSTPASVPLLHKLLHSPDERIRVGALVALAHAGGLEAVDAMIEALGSDDGLTVGWAAHLLAKMRAGRAVPFLIECAEQRGSELGSPGATMFVKALASMRDPRAVGALKLSAVDADRFTRAAAAHGLAAVNTPESKAALEWAATQLSWLHARPIRRALRHARSSTTIS